MGKLALLSAILAGTICAGPIGTYTFTGTATGTLDGTPFASETLTIMLVGDTSTIIQSPSTTFALTVGPNVSTFDLAGSVAASGTFSDSTYVFDNQTDGSDGEAGFGADSSDEVNTFGLSPAFATYNLETSLGPLGPKATDGDAPFSTPTSAGILDVTSFDNSSFQAVVTGAAMPEPATLSLLSAGVLGIVFVARRRR